MENINKLLNEEKQARNVLANIEQRKEVYGTQLISEVKEKLNMLGVGYLLNANITERVMAPVRISRLDGRVLKLKARKQDVERISLLETQRKELQQTINDLIQEVAELKESDEKIADLEKQLKETQDKLDAAKKKEQEYADAIKDYDTKEKELEKKISELESSNNSNILKQVIVSKDKYIAELESKLADKAYQAANDGYLVDGVEISLAVVNELNDEIEKLREEMADKEHLIAELNKKVKALELTDNASEELNDFNDPGYQEILMQQAEQYMNNDTDECLFIADDIELENNANQGGSDKDKQISDTVKNVLDNRKGDGKRGGTPKERFINEFNNITDEDIDAATFEIPTGNDNKEESKQEESEVKAPEFVKEVCAQVGGNVNAKLYQTESCFLIASSTTKEITWIANGPISDEYKDAVEQMLIAEKKILPNRLQLSPVIVQTEDGYMARANAVNGVDKFDREDILVGYVKIDGKFYLYSYSAQYRSPGKNIKSLDALLNNDPIVNPDKAMCSRVTSRVWKMNKEYQKLVKEEIERRAEEAKASSEAREEKKKKRNSRFKANTELVLQSGIAIGKKESKLKGINVSTGNSGVTTVNNGGETTISGDTTAIGEMVDDFAASMF